MPVKTITNYSPNFSKIRRNNKKIKYLIFHYTGMKTDSDAIKKLTRIQSQVSAHYFIKRNGDIVIMVPDNYIAWHAGVSAWSRDKYLNKNSIGIEISNPGHQFNYKNFTEKQIISLIELSKKLIKKYKIKKEYILGLSDIAPERKIDPGEKFSWEKMNKNKIGIWHKISSKKLVPLRCKKLSKIEKFIFKKYLKKIGYVFSYRNLKTNKKIDNYIFKAFQRRFRQSLVNGKIDKECLLIAKKLAI